MASTSSDCLQDEPYRRRQPFPIRFLGTEIFLPRLSQRIILCAAIVLRFAPFCLDPRLLFKAMQSGIERALIHMQNVVRNAPNALRNGPAVHGLERDRFQNEEVKSALN